MNKSKQINELAAALSKAQAEFTLAKKDEKNHYYSSKYADLASLLTVTQGPMGKNGLSILQVPTSDLELQIASVETILMHSSGQWISEVYSMPATSVNKDGRVKFDAQTIGIAITYARRYALQSFLCLAAEDEDANALINEREDANALINERIATAKATPPTFSKPIQELVAAKPASTKRVISEAQQKRFYAITRTANATTENVKNVLKHFSYDHSKDIQIADYEALCNRFVSGEWEHYAAPKPITDADLPEGLGEPNPGKELKLTPIDGVDNEVF